MLLISQLERTVLQMKTTEMEEYSCPLLEALRCLKKKVVILESDKH